MGLFNFIKKDSSNTDRPILFAKEFLIVGEKYECRKNSKKQRMGVIKKTTLKSSIHIERYTYQGKPAYMVVNTKEGLDLGVLSAGAASWLTDYYYKGNVEAYLVDKFQDSFHAKIVIYKK